MRRLCPMPNTKPKIMNNYVDDHWLDILHELYGMFAHLSAQGEFVCFVVPIVLIICNIVLACIIFTIMFYFK